MSIVVGYVPTPEGRAALETAAAEAALRGVSLTVVRTQSRGHEFGAEEGERFDTDLADALRPLGDHQIDHAVRAPVGSTDPSENLIAVAEEVKAPLIVIGLRRRSKVGKLILGSHAQRVLLDASCPVLAVKAPETPW
ncbi:MAG: universal stress protein [Ornithinimicrobium sp.]